jgi:hypothetical protein
MKRPKFIPFFTKAAIQSRFHFATCMQFTLSYTGLAPYRGIISRIQTMDSDWSDTRSIHTLLVPHCLEFFPHLMIEFKCMRMDI